jgi:hypothetical protein
VFNCFEADHGGIPSYWKGLNMEGIKYGLWTTLFLSITKMMDDTKEENSLLINLFLESAIGPFVGCLGENSQHMYIVVCNIYVACISC